MRSFLLISFLLIMSAFNLNCGGGTDIESAGGRLTGLVIGSKGKTDTKAQLKLVPQSHTPFTTETIYNANTDSSGNYYFSNVDTGVYNLEAVDPSDGTRLLKYGIHITENQETSVPPETLKVTGNIIITTDPQANSNTGIIYIQGTSIIGKFSKSLDSIIIDSLPTGVVLPILHADRDGKQVSPLTDTLILHPAETLVLPQLQNWKYSGRIYLNTSTISSDIGDIPVLLRLNGSNFDFSQAVTRGNDLRFSYNGTFLQYEIERWDSTEANAAIWIRLDTLKVNNPDQFITMYWGNPNAKNGSSGKNVFDTSAGYRSVLHISQESPGVANRNLYQDVSALSNNGDDYIYARDRSGVIGYGKHFDVEEEDFILIDSLKGCSFGTGPFTISFWFKSDYKQAADLFTMYFGESDTIPLSISLDTTNSVSVSCENNILLSSPIPEENAWTHLVLMRSSSQIMTLYLNGQPVKTAAFSKNITTKTIGSIFLGSNINAYITGSTLSPKSFNGNIDEFRIDEAEHSDAFVKFSYLNQYPEAFLNIEK